MIVIDHTNGEVYRNTEIVYISTSFWNGEEMIEHIHFHNRLSEIEHAGYYALPGISNVTSVTFTDINDASTFMRARLFV